MRLSLLVLPLLVAIAPMRAAHASNLEKAPDAYTEIRFGAGAGTSTALSNEDNEAADEFPLLNLSLLSRRGARVVGLNGQRSGGLFSPSHSYLGGVAGYASPGRAAHVELLGEGGAHMVTGLGDGLFSESVGDSTAMVPYLGIQARLVMDPGKRHGLVIELAVAQRMDLTHTTQTVVSESCFLGCSTSTETWRLGGTSREVFAGISYQFD